MITGSLEFFRILFASPKLDAMNWSRNREFFGRVRKPIFLDQNLRKTVFFFSIGSFRAQPEQTEYYLSADARKAQLRAFPSL